MKKKNRGKKLPVSEKIADALELPREVAAGVPKITIWPDREAEVLNHKGIIEYDSEIIRLNSSEGIITINGEQLSIKSFTDDEISVSGRVKKIEI